jgi:hypothetical protein
VFVFEEDIDVTSYEQIDWAIAYRVIVANSSWSDFDPARMTMPAAAQRSTVVRFSAIPP